ncbi:alpha-hydroxy acid oxidase [Paraburkholderia tagetis]|uniref:Alpha-hydroxy-acid oxidizing protein n=1 Tax=Paraburkholderia tagetis TaxID=2913261 RepID=A0A9X1UFP4_9BURK|nr:alpha-hydroxy acid oxidase [Paraburkholderia tagetis]MCG5074814.1 alpha-hydroxy-acid oxidizing protein [Paraburkholderia tagetis]
MADTVTCVDDLQRLARRRVPKIFYDYVDSGSWTESTYRANEVDLGQLKFRQRVGCNVDMIRTAATLLGRPCSLPVALAPTGLAGMIHADGEILAARAAARFGVPFTLSTVSICSIEDVAEHVAEPFWFQLYMMKDRDFIVRLIERARNAGCSALVLTLDLPLQGQRHKDVRNGLSVPPKLNLRTLSTMMARPAWCARMLGTRRRTFGNIVGHAKGVTDTFAFAEWVSRQFDRTVTWDDIGWIKRHWGGRLIVKGILDADDARRAVAAGADAIIVSNHGGRQLDGAPSSISALPAIAAAVGQQTEVLMDGGIRSGQDVLRALAWGAHGVMIGRAFLYGLGALGEAGVTRTLELIHKELESTMALCGITDVADVGRDAIVTTAPVAASARPENACRLAGESGLSVIAWFEQLIRQGDI